jgi:hypothetical protein
LDSTARHRRSLSTAAIICIVTCLTVACQKDKPEEQKVDPAPTARTEASKDVKIVPDGPATAPDIAAKRVSETDVRVEPPNSADVSAAPPAVPVRPMPAGLQSLLQCAAEQSRSVPDSTGQAAIALGIATVRAHYDSAAAVRAIRSAPPVPEVLPSLEEAVLALATRDLNSALKALDGLASADHRRHCLGAIARQLVQFDTPRALQVAERIDPRIVREGLLLDIVNVALEQSAAAAHTVSERIIEPLLNDYAAADIAAGGAAADFEKASELAETIESPFVKQWAYLAMLLAVAAHDPERALSLENRLPLAHHLDELHSRAAEVLAGQNAQKALSVALRIGDKTMRGRALQEVARRLFPTRPAFAFHLLVKEIGDERAWEHLVAWTDALCSSTDGDFEATYEAVKRKLSEDRRATLLLACCRYRPREVRRLAMEVPPALVMPLRRCYLCAGIESDAQAVLDATVVPGQMDRLRACTAQQLAADKPAAALEALAGIGDKLVADEARLEMVTDLLARSKGGHALEVARHVQDSYLRGLGLLGLLAQEAVGGEAKALLLLVLENLTDTWRSDDLRARAALILTSHDLEFAARLAGSIVNPARSKRLMGLMMPLLSGPELARAASLSGNIPAGKARARWCLQIAKRQAAIDCQKPAEQP